MPDEGEQALEAAGDVALGDLAVIDVELQKDLPAPDRLDHRHRLVGGVEEIARHVAMVDRLDEEPHPRLRRPFRRPGEVGGIEAGQGHGREPGGGETGHHVDLMAAQCVGVIEGAADAVAELLLAAGETGETPLPRRPVAGGRVEQDLGEARILQPAFDLGRRMVIGEEILDPGEPGPRRRGETLRKRKLLKHHRQIGAKTKHALLPLEPSPSS